MSGSWFPGLGVKTILELLSIILAMCNETFACSFKIAACSLTTSVLFQVEHLEHIPLLSLNAELYKVEYRQLQLFSDVATSTGLVG